MRRFSGKGSTRMSTLFALTIKGNIRLYDVLIDTCIYRQDPQCNKPGFRTVKRLAQGGKIHLRVPVFVKREFVSRQVEEAQEDITKITGAATRINRLTN